MADNTAKGKPHKAKPYITKENARELQAKSVASRRARAQSARAKLAERLDGDFDGFYARLKEKIEADGDMRALFDAWSHAYGRPVSEVELSGAAGGAIQIVVESCFDLEPDDSETQPDE